MEPRCLYSVQSSLSLLIQPSPPLQMATHPAALQCSCAALWCSRAVREELIFLVENNKVWEEQICSDYSILTWDAEHLEVGYIRDAVEQRYNCITFASPTPILGVEPQCCKKIVNFCCCYFSVDTNQEFWRELGPKYIWTNCFFWWCNLVLRSLSGAIIMVLKTSSIVNGFAGPCGLDRCHREVGKSGGLCGTRL